MQCSIECSSSGSSWQGHCCLGLQMQIKYQPADDHRDIANSHSVSVAQIFLMEKSALPNVKKLHYGMTSSQRGTDNVRNSQRFCACYQVLQRTRHIRGLLNGAVKTVWQTRQPFPPQSFPSLGNDGTVIICRMLYGSNSLCTDTVKICICLDERTESKTFCMLHEKAPSLPGRYECISLDSDTPSFFLSFTTRQCSIHLPGAQVFPVRLAVVSHFAR